MINHNNSKLNYKITYKFKLKIIKNKFQKFKIQIMNYYKTKKLKIQIFKINKTKFNNNNNNKTNYKYKLMNTFFN